MSGSHTSDDRTIKESILERMLNGYAKPDHVADIGARMQDYCAVLRQFDPFELKAGWLIVLETHRYKSWPEPAAIVAACRKAREAAAQHKHAAATAATDARHDQHRQAAEAAMLTEVGREALRDGWSRSLYQAVEKAGSLDRVDVDRLRFNAALFRSQLAAWREPASEDVPEAPALTDALRRLGFRLEAVEKEFAARFQGAS